MLLIIFSSFRRASTGPVRQPWSRGLHSSTFRLDVSTNCGVRLMISVTKTAQVELRIGRVQASAMVVHCAAAECADADGTASNQGLTLVQFTAQRQHCLSDMLGGFSEKTAQVELRSGRVEAPASNTGRVLNPAAAAGCLARTGCFAAAGRLTVTAAATAVGGCLRGGSGDAAR